MLTYRLTLEYEGTRYRGWQEQPEAATVAGELRRALERAGAEVHELGGAGRTDAGVHALAQTAHLRTARALEPERLRRAVDAELPADIHVLSIRRAPASFHARHDALWRSYLYQVSHRRTALAKRFVWWPKRALDVERMAAAAALLVGRHDFAGFCHEPDDQASTLVEVERAEVAEEGALVLVRLVASHFLWKLVRRLVGTLVEVGAGELEPRDFAALLAGRAPVPGRPGPAQWTAPASGLFLERVLYPGEPPLDPLASAVAVRAAGAPSAGGAGAPAARRGRPRRGRRAPPE